MGLVSALAALYLVLLIVKTVAALWVIRRARMAPSHDAAASQADVAILQPILGGDAQLQQVLAANLQADRKSVV